MKFVWFTSKCSDDFTICDTLETYLIYLKKLGLVNSATAFALIGKMAVSASFAIVYNYSAEIYPTSVR